MFNLNLRHLEDMGHYQISRFGAIHSEKVSLHNGIPNMNLTKKSVYKTGGQ